MSEHCYEDSVFVARIDDDSANLLPVAQPQMPPALAGVCRFVDAVACGKVRTLNPLARPDVNHIRIRRSNGKITNRSGRLIVKDRCPYPPGICGLPHSAVVHADVKHVRLASNSGSANRTSTSEWSDHSPLEVGIECRVNSLCR